MATVVATLVVGYGFKEPDSAPGYLGLRLIYSTDDPGLSRISSHLALVNGSYLPDRHDAFLFTRLEDGRSAAERDNVLRFYAHQAALSRAGSRIFASGSRFNANLVRLGREASTKREQLEYLYLLEGVRRGRELYKPGVWVRFEGDAGMLDGALARYASGEDTSTLWSEPQ